VRCDPTQPYDPDFVPPYRGDVPAKKGADAQREVPVSRPNFIALCQELTAIDEAAFEELFRRLGMSFDWTTLYTTIDARSRRASQVAFLHNLARGEAYSADAPTVWDVDDRTAVAQAEIEDRERPGAYHLIAFHHGEGDGDVLIDTTRPELIVSCVALVAHPDDERYRPLFGTTVRTPRFGVEVPVVAHPLAQPDKGTGIAMVCTFGDTTDYFYRLAKSKDRGDDLYSTCFEFGTIGDGFLDSIISLKYTVDENRQHWYPTDDPITAEMVKENYYELFYPTETQWREKTIVDFKTAMTGVLSAKLK
jgi:hypothetical protein